MFQITGITEIYRGINRFTNLDGTVDETRGLVRVLE